MRENSFQQKIVRQQQKILKAANNYWKLEQIVKQNQPSITKRLESYITESKNKLKEELQFPEDKTNQKIKELAITVEVIENALEVVNNQVPNPSAHDPLPSEYIQIA